MIDVELANRIKNMEAVISGLSRRVAVLEGEPQESPEEVKAKARVDYEQRMAEIPSAFWKEPVSE